MIKIEKWNEWMKNDYRKNWINQLMFKDEKKEEQ
jgi:hypothetical protein